LALRLTGGARTTARGEHRIVPGESVREPDMRAEGEWALQSRNAEDQDLRTVYAFADGPRQRSEIGVGNWWSSRTPGPRCTGARAPGEDDRRCRGFLTRAHGGFRAESLRGGRGARVERDSQP